MLHNPDAFNAEILAGDIRRYRQQGVSLDVIHQGAITNGVPETMWQEAVRIFDIQQKSIRKAQRQQAKKTKKIIIFFTAMILVGGFFMFLIYQNIDTFKSIQTTTPQKTETEIKKTQEETNTQKTEKNIESENNPTDVRFNNQVASGNLYLDFFGTGKDQKIFRSIANADSFLSNKLGTYAIKSAKIAFDDQSNPVFNHFELYNERKLPYFLLSNTLTPFQFQSATALFHQTNKTDLVDEKIMYNNQEWKIFLEKIEFDTRPKAQLSFSAELFMKNNKPHFKVSYDYPDDTQDAVLEVEFMPFTKGNGQKSIAFGRQPTISSGFLEKKYPIRRGPVPRSIN